MCLLMRYPERPQHHLGGLPAKNEWLESGHKEIQDKTQARVILHNEKNLYFETDKDMRNKERQMKTDSGGNNRIQSMFLDGIMHQQGRREVPGTVEMSERSLWIGGEGVWSVVIL